MPVIELEPVGTGPGCSKCPMSFPTKRVLVRAGNVVRVDGRPFQVAVDAEFFMCVRCRSCFIPQAFVPVAVSTAS